MCNLLEKEINLQLSKFFQENLYSNLLEQLNKDFRLSGLTNTFTSQPEILLNDLYTVVLDLITNRFSDYLNLLYRIDISERQVKALDGSDISILSKQVSLMILRRECQKVLFKNKI